MEERRFHPLDYVSVVQRRKWWFITPLVLSLLVGTGLAVFLPREYRSEAEIGVANATLSPELLRGVQSFDAKERQRAISQQLLSRTVLERVVREENIRPGRPVEETAAAMRSRVEENIAVPQPIGRMGQRDGIESFRLGWVDSSAERAQRIADRLATVFVEENSKTKTQQAQNTSEVLAQQLSESRQRLAQLEEQLRVKKQAHMGRLPDQMNANVQMANGLRTQHESLTLQLRSEQDRLALVESQIELMKKEGAGAGMTTLGQSAIQTAQGRIGDLQRQLRQYQANGYTDQHPDVVATREELKSAQNELATARQQSAGSNAELLAADPAYRQRVQEREATRLRIAALQRQAAQALAQINAYQSKVDSAPMVEQELRSLVRDEELERARFMDLSSQHQKAVLAEDVTRKQGGERFVILNPARLPSAPVTPDLVRLMAMALAIGLFLGVAAVIGREFLDRSVHDARALQSEFEVPVLGEIPHIQAT